MHLQYVLCSRDCAEVWCGITQLWPCAEGNIATDWYLIYSVDVMLDILHWDKWRAEQRAVCPVWLKLPICWGCWTLSFPFLFSISYRELALSKLSASDKWSNPIRAELLKASYLPARQPGQLKHRNLSLSHCGCSNVCPVAGEHEVARRRAVQIDEHWWSPITWTGWLPAHPKYHQCHQSGPNSPDRLVFALEWAASLGLLGYFF